ncbi:xylulokinase [Mesorhizobium sp. ZMM04-5]|uniref:Xylulokinase n=1 Tax=Mesorhizobium marinum TaxID=3228790 RepID=A0ABV3R3H6_9HYPH
MADDLTLGIDFGTSAVKVVALAADGTVAAQASRPYATYKPAADRAEQEPQDWWDALCAATHEMMAALDPACVVAAGLSGQLNGVVLVDANGVVLGRSHIWLDQRCARETAELRQFHADALAVTSSPISPIAVLPKLQWLKRHEPERIAAASRVFQVKDYILWRLTGALATDANEASATSLMDLGRRAWDDRLVELAGIDAAQLCPILPASRMAGRVTPAAASQTGLPVGLGVAPGAGDTGALGVGCGAFATGTVAVTLGTAGHVVASVPNRPQGIAPGLWRMAHVAPDRELWLGLIPAGGLSIAWLRRIGRGFGGRDLDFSDLERLAQDVPPGSDGAVFLPFLEGAGTPWNDPARLAGYGGLSVAHEAGHLVRAVYEGVAFNVRACLERFEQEGVVLDRVHLAEGGAQSPLWCQIIADALGRDVHVVAERDTSAIGAAILARAATGTDDLDSVIARSVRIARVHRPDPAARDAIQASLALFARQAGAF